MSKRTQELDGPQTPTYVNPKRRKVDRRKAQEQPSNQLQQNLSHQQFTSPADSPVTNEEYTVGWICALPIELAAAKGMMDEEYGDPQTPADQADENTYLLGRIGKFHVVVACLPKHEIGVSSVAAVARDMLHTFSNIKVGLLVGIAAGIPDYESDNIRDIRLGDVVISSDKENGGVVMYDFGTRLPNGTFENKYALNQPPRPIRSALSKLEAVHQTRENKIRHYIEQMLEKYPYMRKRGYSYPGAAADQLFPIEYQHKSGRSCTKCDPAKQVNRPADRANSDPVIHFGVVATGSQVVKHAPTRDEISQKHRAICLEMEAAGLMNHFPCAVFRGISDYGDSHKNDQWHPYAAAAAAACAKEFLEYIQPRELQRERAVKDMFDQILNEVSDANLNIQDIREQSHKVEEDKIFNWLTPIDYAPQQSDLITIWEPRTCQWLLNSNIFQKWVDQTRQTLFCPGIPGAGKTVITSVVVNELFAEFRNDTSVGIAYIYCNFRLKDDQKLYGLLSSLVKQLVQPQSSFPECVRVLHKNHSACRTRPSLSEISITLQSVAALYSRVFFIIDALDECADQCRTEFLSEIFNIQSKVGANIFATSRNDDEIAHRFDNALSLKIRAANEDVEAYVNKQIVRPLA